MKQSETRALALLSLLALFQISSCERQSAIAPNLEPADSYVQPASGVTSNIEANTPRNDLGNKQLNPPSSNPEVIAPPQDGNFFPPPSSYGSGGGGYHGIHEDQCINDPDKKFPGPCGCGVPDTDNDQDGVADCIDNCPLITNSNQENSDDDNVGDACDNCPSISNQDQADGDSDTIGDGCDNCPSDSNQDQADEDADNIGDICDNCPTIANHDQTNSDSDTLGDACDNCRHIRNANQVDSDGDSIGDTCDNCPSISNQDQINSDSDAQGKACDCDDNNATIGAILGTSRYVSPVGDDISDCSTSISQCLTIAHAIAVANSGDTIILSTATFYETGLTIQKNLQIFGDGPTSTIVDADGSKSVFIVNENATATFCGLTITGGGMAPLGGGIFIDGGSTVTGSNIEVTNNSAESGGGIGVANNQNMSFGALTLINSTVSSNQATMTNGGGISNFGNAIIKSSTLSNNTASSAAGGGIHNSATSTAIIVNSTLSANGALNGGAVSNDLQGIVTIKNSTLSQNTASNTAGGIQSNGAVSIAHTILTTNAPNNCAGSASPISNDFNLDSGTSCALSQTHDLSNANADLSSLALNGGPTKTHALGTNSDAIDAGAADCGDALITTDQRGLLRPVDDLGHIDQIPGGICDIGAFEVHP